MKSSRGQIFWTLAILTAVAPGAIGWGTQDAETQGGAGFMTAKGRVSFQTYCASCHGRDGRGDGNLAQYLTVEPADLTEIRVRRDGQFPRQEIAEIIDGRQETRGHGSREMPVWGDVFQSPLAETERTAAEDPEERVARKLEELVHFLESIQEQP